MIELTHPVTGHKVRTDEESSDFWQASGYRPASSEKKTPAKKSASSKSSK